MVLPFLLASFGLAALLYLNKKSKVLDAVGLAVFFGLLGFLTVHLACNEGVVENVYFQADPLALLFLVLAFLGLFGSQIVRLITGKKQAD